MTTQSEVEKKKKAKVRLSGDMCGCRHPSSPWHGLYQILTVHRLYVKFQTPSQTQVISIFHCERRVVAVGDGPSRLAAARLLLVVLCGELDDGTAVTGLVLTGLAGLQSLAGDNAVDF